MTHKPNSIFEAARLIMEGIEIEEATKLQEGAAESASAKVSTIVKELDGALITADKTLDKLAAAIDKAEEYYEDAYGMLPAGFKERVQEFNDKLKNICAVGAINEPAPEHPEEDEEELEDQEEGIDPDLDPDFEAQIDPDSLEDEEDEEEDDRQEPTYRPGPGGQPG